MVVMAVPLAFWNVKLGVYILVEVSEVPFAFAKLNSPERLRLVPVALTNVRSAELVSEALRFVEVIEVPLAFAKVMMPVEVTFVVLI